MNQNLVGESNSVRVKIEENITVKTEERDSDYSDANIPLADFNADSSEKGSIVEFQEEMTRFIKLEPNTGPSGSGERFLPSESESVTIKTVAIEFDDANFHADDKANITECYEGETSFIKPEPNSDPSGSGERNIRVNRPKKGKYFSCPECAKAFTDKSNFNRHINGVHMKLKKYVCQECDTALSSQQQLKAHVDAVHLKLKKYICQQCGHAFSRLLDLKKHVDSVHLKLKKYVCQECSSAFSEQANLKKHIDAVHLKLKRYVCQQCNYAFPQQAYLTRHVNAVHLKLRKYICHDCSRAFSRRGYLKKHIIAIHISK